MEENKKRWLKLFIGILAICVFLYAVFMVGASYSCVKSGGSLFSDGDVLECLNISSVDLCRDYNGRVIEKPVGFSFFEFNVSGDLYG